jgi:hypothetical protein
MSKQFAQKNSYPLQWPSNIPQAKRTQSSRFDSTLFQALENVEHSLELLANDSGKKIGNIVFSSNVTLGDLNPDDSGVCVYFNWNGADLCIPVDRYDKVQDNLQAIYHILEADRTKLRHGGLEFVMAEKQGKTNLISDGSDKNWRDVLGFDNGKISMSQVKKRYRELAKQHHSDRGGNDTTMAAINRAWEEAKKELSNH